MSGWVYVRVVVKVSWYMMSVLVSGQMWECQGENDWVGVCESGRGRVLRMSTYM